MLMKSFVAAVFVAGAVGYAVAQEKKAEPTAKEEKFESKKEDRKPSCCRASLVNFTKELGVPLEYLNTIGTRIATARKTPDPVELALAAQALAVAEGVSGKKASLTSTEVFAEALDLAMKRNVSAELAAVAMVAPDQANKDSLTKSAAVAKKLEAEEKAKPQGEGSREILESLTVTNETGECVKIYVDGFYVGTVHRGGTKRFGVHTHTHKTEVTAICEDGGEVVGRSYAHGHHHNVSWTVR